MLLAPGGGPRPTVPPASRVALAALAASVLASAACTVPADSPFDPQQLGPSGVLHLVSSTPPDQATGVDRDVAVRLVFDGFPDPATLTPFGALAVRSGVNSFDFTAGVDLVARAVTVRPRTRLAADTGYAIAVTTGLRSLDGSPAVPTTVRLQAGSAASGPPPDPPARTLAADVQPLLTGGCAFAGCHDAISRSAGLVLEEGQAYGQLVGVPSTERPERLRVEPGNPAQSYLLRKLLGTPDILQQAMPIGATWPDDALRLISDWIEGGARP